LILLQKKSSERNGAFDKGGAVPNFPEVRFVGKVDGFYVHDIWTCRKTNKKEEKKKEIK
jgi:hypothetical protein